jgi:hypothetical protein
MMALNEVHIFSFRVLCDWNVECTQEVDMDCKCKEHGCLFEEVDVESKNFEELDA